MRKAFQAATAAEARVCSSGIDIRTLEVVRDSPFLPAPNEMRLVLLEDGDTPPGDDLVTAAFALAFDGDSLLMTKLRDARRGWDIPGGRLEPGETAERAMRREVYEETAARLGPARLFAYQRIRLGAPKPDADAYPYPDSYMVFFRAPVFALESFVANDEAEERGLLPPSAVPGTIWGRKNRALYDAALAAPGRSPAPTG